MPCAHEHDSRPDPTTAKGGSDDDANGSSLLCSRVLLRCRLRSTRQRRRREAEGGPRHGRSLRALGLQPRAERRRAREDARGHGERAAEPGAAVRRAARWRWDGRPGRWRHGWPRRRDGRRRRRADGSAARWDGRRRRPARGDAGHPGAGRGAHDHADGDRDRGGGEVRRRRGTSTPTARSTRPTTAPPRSRPPGRRASSSSRRSGPAGAAWSRRGSSCPTGAASS